MDNRGHSRLMVRLGVISGGFDPIHRGHIAYIQSAAKQCDYLYVGCNTDEWLQRKKGKAFMPYEDRCSIVKNIKGVYDVVPFNDDDGSAYNLIEIVHGLGFISEGEDGYEVVFFNGGDRNKENIPEEVLCKENNIPCEFEFGVGGEDKKNSSSWILEEWSKPVVERKWGTYKVLDNQKGWAVKELAFDPGKSLSDQKHTYRSEHWHVVSGEIRMELEHRNGNKISVVYGAGDSIDIPKHCWHKATNVGSTTAKVIEVWMGETLTEEDIERRD